MKKVFSFLFAICFVASMFAETTTIYCKMTQGWWTTDNAAVSLHYWGGSSAGTTWPGPRGAAVEGEAGLWQFTVPTDVTGLIFVRTNAGQAGQVGADWGAKTADLTLPTDGKNLFTITNESAVWGNPGCTGEWSTYVAPAPDPNDHRMAGEYTVGGEGANFASLAAAAMAIDTCSLKGDVTLRIAADLTESVNAAFVNTTDYYINIRPAAGAMRTITYTSATDNAGPSGSIVIGCKMATDDQNISTHIPFPTTEQARNVVINGYATDADTESSLTIIGGSAAGAVVVACGDVQNSAVKNCILKNNRTTSTNYVVVVRSRGTLKPVGFLIENNHLINANVANAQTIYLRGDQGTTATDVPTDTKMKNNIIEANLRGIFFNKALNAEIEGNTFVMAAASGGFLAHAIMGNAQSGVINVKANKFSTLKTTNTSPNDYGIQAITASGGADVWNIENNYFGGFDALGAVSETAIKVLGVRCGDSCVVRHNTFHMPALTNKPATAMTSAYPISLLYLAGTKQYIVENNLFVSDETVANNSLIRGALNPNVKNNVFYHAGGNAAVIAGATIVTGEADVTAGGKWHAVSLNGYELTGASDGDTELGVPRLEVVLRDIEGTVRPEVTYAGCYEASTLALPQRLWIIGACQTANWTPATSKEMTRTADGVFEVVETLVDATSWFAFTSSNSSNWDMVNMNRYGANPSGALVTVGEAAAITGVGGDYSFTMPQGTYKFVVDLNAMTLTVTTDASTDLENVETVKAVKFFRNGQLLIQKGDAIYTATGVRVQ